MDAPNYHLNIAIGIFAYKVMFTNCSGHTCMCYVEFILYWLNVVLFGWRKLFGRVPITFQEEQLQQIIWTDQMFWPIWKTNISMYSTMTWKPIQKSRDEMDRAPLEIVLVINGAYERMFHE